MNVLFTKKFTKQFRKLPDKSRHRFHSRLELFLTDQNHALLRRHALKGKYAGYYGLDVSGDLRAVFRYQSQSSVIFSLVGTRSQIY